MKKEVTISLIIATYNWPEALRLCLKSILKQTILPTEIIIADDGSDERTAKLIHDFAQKVSFPIFHEWHEDKELYERLPPLTSFKSTEIL